MSKVILERVPISNACFETRAQRKFDKSYRVYVGFGDEKKEERVETGIRKHLFSECK